MYPLGHGRMDTHDSKEPLAAQRIWLPTVLIAVRGKNGFGMNGWMEAFRGEANHGSRLIGPRPVSQNGLARKSHRTRLLGGRSVT